jgi:hypothetical protein
MPEDRANRTLVPRWNQHRRQLLGTGANRSLQHPNINAQDRRSSMHDIDRVQLETQSEAEMLEAFPLQAQHFEFAQSEASSGETGEVFGETEQMELASGLLEVTNEAELDRFLGDLIQRAGQAVGKFIKSPEGQAIGSALKGAAKQVLPAIGSAVGGYIGGPTGATLGGDAAAAASRALGLELEGLSGEDAEFEIARRFVNFAGDAVKNMALTPSEMDPRRAARSAAEMAARAYAPGLLSPAEGAMRPQAQFPPSGGRSGRWVRRANKIILYGV